MRLYRQPPLPLSIEVPNALPDTAYDVAIINRNTEWGVAVVSDALGVIKFDLPNYPFAFFDEVYALSIQSEDVTFIWNDGQTSFVDDLEIKRPYWAVNIDDPLELLEEAIISATIDAITGGFYFTREAFEGQGLGTDFFPTPALTVGVLEAWQNNVQVYYKYLPMPGDPDFTNIFNYQMTRDMTAITVANDNQRVSVASRPVTYHNGNSDTYFTHHHAAPFFPEDFYYIFLLSNGYAQIPDDIKLVAELLRIMWLEQGEIGNNDFDDYITEYSTDQFKLSMQSRAGENKGYGSTGNKTVDAILRKYINKATNINRLGVL